MILGSVKRLEQLVVRPFSIRNAAYTGIMTSGYLVGTQRHGVIKKCLEFDFGIAQNIGVGCSPCGVFAQKIGKDPVFVLCSEVHSLNVDPDQIGHADGIKPILARGAIFGIVVVFPVLHEQAKDIVSLLLQKPGSNRGVDPSGHADDDTPFFSS